MEQRNVVVGVAVVAAVLGAALLYGAGPSTGSEAPGSGAAAEAAAPGAATRSDPEAEPGAPADADRPPAGPALRTVIGAAGAQIPPSTRPFASPHEASAYVKGRVVDLLAAVAPEVPADEIEMECASDGRTCTFHGPWPGDDLMARWLRAISEGKTSAEAMGGVRFSRLEPVEDQGGALLFEIVAHAP